MPEINPLSRSFVGGGQPDTISAETEGKLRGVLNSSDRGSAKLQELKAAIAQLPADEKALLKAQLSDPNNDLRQQIDSQVSPSQRDELLQSFDDPGIAPPPHGDPVNIGEPVTDAEHAAETTHALAAQGNLDAAGTDDTKFTVDQWNFYRANGNPPDVPGMTPISPEQAEAMIAANGGVREAPISAQDFLKLLNKTADGPIDTKPIDAPPPASIPEDTLHARAAQGDLNAAGTDNTKLTIDQWNFYRANGNPPDVEPGPVISSSQTDAIIAARGGDRESPVNAKEYLALVEQTKVNIPEPPTDGGRNLDDDLFSKIRAASLRRDS